MKRKCGVLPFKRLDNGDIEFLLGLPGEPYEPHSKRPGFFGVWNLFKGAAEPGEDDKTAAIRELCEETGLSQSIVKEDNFFDLGILGKKHIYGLDVTNYEIDLGSLHSNMVEGYLLNKGLTYKPFPEIQSYKWFTLSQKASIMNYALEAMEIIKNNFDNSMKITESELKSLLKKCILESIKEIRTSHVSHANFDNFDMNAFGTGEGKSPAHGYGIYLAIDPVGNPRYFKQSIGHIIDSHYYAYYYDVEIPDINENNYIFEKYPISRLSRNQIETIKSNALAIGIDLENSPYYSEDMSCKRLLQLLGVLLSNEKYSNYRTVKNSPKSAASGFLNSCGIVGMIYYSKTEKNCAVIFNPSDAKIIKKTSMNDELGDSNIQPKSKDDRDRIRDEFFKNSDFYRQRTSEYEQNPFDNGKYYSFEHYVDDSDDKKRQGDINKFDIKLNKGVKESTRHANKKSSLNEINHIAKNSPITICSLEDFKDICQNQLGINDANVESYAGKFAFIEIGSTLPRCNFDYEYSGCDDEYGSGENFYNTGQYYFKGNYKNVLRLEFDDNIKIGASDKDETGLTPIKLGRSEVRPSKWNEKWSDAYHPVFHYEGAKGFDYAMAKEASTFIQNNIESSDGDLKFIIHCRQGRSRSAALGYYLAKRLKVDIINYFKEYDIDYEDGTKSSQFNIYTTDKARKNGKLMNHRVSSIMFDYDANRDDYELHPEEYTYIKRNGKQGKGKLLSKYKDMYTDNHTYSSGNYEGGTPISKRRH